MIRLEATLKSRWGSPVENSSEVDRLIKRRIISAINDACAEQDLEPVRIQFLGPKKSS